MNGKIDLNQFKVFFIEKTAFASAEGHSGIACSRTKLYMWSGMQKN